MRKVTDNDLASIAERYQYLTVEPFEKLHRLADANPAAAAELDRVEYELGLDADAVRAALRPGCHTEDAPIMLPLDEARHVAREHGFDAPEASETLGMIARAIRVGMERGHTRIVALGEGKIIPSLPAQSAAPSRRSVTIRDAFDSYLKQRDLPTKSVSEVGLALRTFESVVGNKTLESITRDDIRAYVEHIANQKIGGKTPGSVSRYPQEDTLKKRLGFINAAINHALDKGLFDGRNPASNIRVSAFAKRVDRSVMPNKRRLKIDELNKLFQHPWFTGCRSSSETHQPGNHRLNGVEYWGPILALLTGCRAGELAGLRLSEVRLDHPYPHLLIRPNEYRGVKNGESREVPILDMLMEHGFADYVERIARTGADRLLPDWKGKAAPSGGKPAWSNGPMMRAFNRTVIPAALGKRLETGARLEVTFHGLRGAFKAMLSTHAPAVNTNIINEIVGHAKSELDARYIGTISIEDTYPAIRGCRYKGLALPPLP
jgi:integrase